MPFFDAYNSPDPELREFVKDQSKQFAAMILALQAVVIREGMTDADELQHLKIQYLAEVDRVAEEQKRLDKENGDGDELDPG